MLPLLSAVALATTGGPQALAILGLEPTEQKVFLLSERFDDSLSRPQVSYYELQDPPPEQRPDRPVQVESLYRDLGDQPAAELDRRMERLKRPLVALAPATLEGIEVTLTYGAPKVCSSIPENPPCQQVAVIVRWGGQQASTALSTWGDLEIAGAWTIPGTNRRLVVLRHRGLTYESGYDAEISLLLDLPGSAAAR